MDSIRAWNESMRQVLRKYPNFFTHEFQESEDPDIKLKFLTAKRMAVQIYEFELARRARKLVVAERNELARVGVRIGIDQEQLRQFAPTVPPIQTVAWDQDIVDEGWLRMEQESALASYEENVMLNYN